MTYYFFNVLTLISHRNFLFQDCVDTVDMFVSFPSDKPIGIQLLGLVLLRRQPISVCQVMSFFGPDHFLYQLKFTALPIVPCDSDWHFECLPYISQFFLSFLPFSSSTVPSSETVSIAAEFSPLAIFFLMWLSLLMPCPVYWTFYFLSLKKLIFCLIISGWTGLAHSWYLSF